MLCMGTRVWKLRFLLISVAERLSYVGESLRDSLNPLRIPLVS